MLDIVVLHRWSMHMHVSTIQDTVSYWKHRQTDTCNAKIDRRMGVFQLTNEDSEVSIAYKLSRSRVILNRLHLTETTTGQDIDLHDCDSQVIPGDVALQQGVCAFTRDNNPMVTSLTDSDDRNTTRVHPLSTHAQSKAERPSVTS